MSLVEKIRKAREQTVTVGGYTFTVRRPTDIEVIWMHAGGGAADMLRYVVDWQGVQEIDVVPGGAPVSLPYDAEVAREWLADRPDLLLPLADAVVEMYRAHVAAIEDAKKN